MFNWSGFYVGVNAGVGWGRSVWTDAIGGFFTDAAGDQFDTNPRGPLVGGQVGYDWQNGPWVLGIELSGAFGATKDAIVSPFFSVDTVRTKIDSLWSATARLGFAFDRTFVYVKGGYAGANVRANIDSTDTFFEVDRARRGFTVGAGLDHALAPNWILGIEFNHYDFGSAKYSEVIPGDDDPEIFAVRSTVQSLVARLSYKFGG